MNMIDLKTLNSQPLERSAGSLKEKREQLDWPSEKIFRILSIDGGGIRGIFPATFLAYLENSYLDGVSITQYFDLIAGTSTGGIIALGLAAGLRADDLRRLYVERGDEIFPPCSDTFAGRIKHKYRHFSKYIIYRYDINALKSILVENFGELTLASAQTRLCIPSFDGRCGEVYIFKTPHHPDFHLDACESMTKVALATSVAPTFFQPFEDKGFIFVDGGVWANNPTMISLIDALSCFNVQRDNIRILSIGCGDEPFVVNKSKIRFGGYFAWRDVIFAAMRLQSQNALGQAGLLIGANNVVRVDLQLNGSSIQLDDWSRAVKEIPGSANCAFSKFGNVIESDFLYEKVIPWKPFVSV